MNDFLFCVTAATLRANTKTFQGKNCECQGDVVTGGGGGFVVVTVADLVVLTVIVVVIVVDAS